MKDNGIFEFMTPDRAVELYKKIHQNEIPDLEWKFYGRRKPGEQENENAKGEDNQNKEEAQGKEDQQDQLVNTEFDFDEEFGDLDADKSLVNESLRLKKRPDQGAEKKTNLSDIMSDILKESHAETG